jgi:predicted flap endonuclease-1-like 5' DNA nuclease
MGVPVNELRGITAEAADSLAALGIKTSDQLLEASATPAQRKELAGRIGLETRALLELANRADLSRVKGVGGVYSDLLELAGVDTVKELATRRPDNLHSKIAATNQERGLTGKTPTLQMVEDWVAQAKELPKSLSY